MQEWVILVKWTASLRPGPWRPVPAAPGQAKAPVQLGAGGYPHFRILGRAPLLDQLGARKRLFHLLCAPRGAV